MPLSCTARSNEGEKRVVWMADRVCSVATPHHNINLVEPLVLGGQHNSSAADGVRLRNNRTRFVGPVGRPFACASVRG